MPRDKDVPRKGRLKHKSMHGNPSAPQTKLLPISLSSWFMRCYKTVYECLKKKKILHWECLIQFLFNDMKWKSKQKSKSVISGWGTQQVHRFTLQAQCSMFFWWGDQKRSQIAQVSAQGNVSTLANHAHFVPALPVKTPNFDERGAHRGQNFTWKFWIKSFWLPFMFGWSKHFSSLSYLNCQGLCYALTGFDHLVNGNANATTLQSSRALWKPGCKLKTR